MAYALKHNTNYELIVTYICTLQSEFWAKVIIKRLLNEFLRTALRACLIHEYNIGPGDRLQAILALALRVRVNIAI